MKKKSNPIKVIIVFVIFMLFCVAAFFYLSNHTNEDKTPKEEDNPKIMTAVQELLARNLDTNYPPTPKEVLKYYSEITRCFYGEKYSEEELAQLARKSRALFDAELYANQTDEQYLASLNIDINRYKENNMAISSFSVSASTDVEEYTYEGRDWAQLYCIYSVRVGTNITPVQERFLMRKDDLGHWKILGWELVEKDEE